MALDRDVRRAALIATAVTLPLIVIAALVIASITGATDPVPSDDAEPSGAVDVTAPPRASVDTAACGKVLVQLPVSLGALKPRVVRPKPDTPFVVAWGNPAVVLACGENRPAALKAGSSEQAVAAGPLSGPYYFVTRSGDANVFTTVDRAAYVSVTIPSKYQGADIMPPLSDAIAKALPAVCSTEETAPLAKTCVRRK